MRRSFGDCTLDLNLNPRSEFAVGAFAAAAYTLAAAAIVALSYSAPSRAADSYDTFDRAIAAWNKACQHQVWPYLDSQCIKGAEVGSTVRVIGGPQIPAEFYRDAEGLDPADAVSGAAAGNPRATATSATRANKA